VVDPVTRMKIKSLARQYDEVCFRTLGSFASEPTVEPHIRIEAIKVLLDRGHGRPKGEKKHTHKGTVNLTMRHIHEGKPKGEK
jgi:hypothetical protein